MLLKKTLRALLVLGASLTALPSQAALLEYLEDPEPDFVENMYIKPGTLIISPHVESGPMEFYGLNDVAAMALEEGPQPGTGVNVANEIMTALTLGYTLPFGDRHWSIETILAPPLKFKFYAAGRARYESLAPETPDGTPTGVPALGKKLGQTMQLPPILTLVYHFFPNAIYRPYVGVGATYIYSYHEKITNPVLNQIERPEIEISEDWAWAVQVGLDIDFYKNFFTSVDFKYIGDAEVTAVTRNIQIPTAADWLAGAPAVIDRNEVTMELDPFVWQLSLGYRF